MNNPSPNNRRKDLSTGARAWRKPRQRARDPVGKSPQPLTVLGRLTFVIHTYIVLYRRITEIPMAKEAKEMVAVRLQPSARRKIKALASRLKANESDILRFAIEVALEELSPLCDPVLEGD